MREDEFVECVHERVSSPVQVCDGEVKMLMRDFVAISPLYSKLPLSREGKAMATVVLTEPG